VMVVTIMLVINLFSVQRVIIWVGEVHNR
jgi:hypothetical protein